MKTKFILILLLVILSVALGSCTKNQSARKFGGAEEIKLQPGERLVLATWKESNLWYLTEPMDSGYIPKKLIFRETSNFGVWEGTVTFIESR